jgi:ketosteroid isomerase-like protein
MTDHPNVQAVNSMTQAIFQQDRDALARLFTDDMTLHVRGPWDQTGDHKGVDGLLGVLGVLFEATGGDIQLDQKFCVGTDGWAAEWEHATLGRNGNKLESDNSFVYRFEGGLVAEMWMFIGVLPERVGAFFD